MAQQAGDIGRAGKARLREISAALGLAIELLEIHVPDEAPHRRPVVDHIMEHRGRLVRMRAVQAGVVGAQPREDGRGRIEGEDDARRAEEDDVERLLRAARSPAP